MRIRALLVAGLLAASAAAAATGHAPAAGPSAPAPLRTDGAAEAAQEAMLIVYAQLREREFASAASSLAAILESPSFDALGAEQQYEILSLAGRLARDLDDPARAHPLLVRASGYSQAEGGVWYARLMSAADIQDEVDVARCIAMLARRWPAIMGELDERAIVQLAVRLERRADAASEYRELLDALFDTGFTLAGESPDALWLALLRQALEQDHVARARVIARRIKAPRSLLALAVDRRFDRAVEASERFALDAAIDTDLAQVRARVAAEPDRLVHRTALQRRLLDAARFAEALADADAVIAQVADGGGAKRYVDFADEYPWTLDHRAVALQGLGRWGEAVVQLRRAARRPEGGGMNVSQALNLAWLHAELGQAEQALEAVEDIGEMSPYGRMQLEMLRLMVAVQREDAPAVARHLGFMREHRDDAIGTYELALLHADRGEAAAALLIERLRRPDWRSEALLEVQPYKQVPMPPIKAARSARHAALVSRADVRAAIGEVGRLAPAVPLVAPAF